MNFFLYNIVVAAYSVFVYVVSRAGRQVDCMFDVQKTFTES